MTYYNIKTEDIIHNYRTLCAHTKSCIIPMLKADGYGLGAQKIKDILFEQGARLFAVSRLEEAMALDGEGEILVLSCYHAQEDIEMITERGFTAAVDSVEQAEALARCAQKLGKKAAVHIAVDTGFGRFGFTSEDFAQIARIYQNEWLEVRGIFSHLGAAFFYKEPSADKQLCRFEQLVFKLKEEGIAVGLCHIANSSALLRDQKFHLDAVRVGSALCGRLPVPFDLPLRRVGELRSDVIDIRRLPKGHNVGYGLVYSLKRDSRVAVIAVGTTDGVQLAKDYDTFRFRDFCRYGLRLLKMMLRRDNRMRVTINGKSVPVLGRVALTHMMVDVTDIDCSVGDEAIIPISPLYVSSRVARRYE